MGFKVNFNPMFTEIFNLLLLLGTCALTIKCVPTIKHMPTLKCVPTIKDVPPIKSVPTIKCVSIIRWRKLIANGQTFYLTNKAYLSKLILHR